MSAVRCQFYVRLPRENGQWRYESMCLSGWHGDMMLHTPFPPAAGDRILLGEPASARPEPFHGVFEVLARQWMHSGYGSGDWPYGQPEPSSGPELMIIVQPADGIFVNEAGLDDAERAGYE